MKTLLVVIALMLAGGTAMADEPGADCAALLHRIDAKLKVIRIRKDAYDKVMALKDEGQAAMNSGGDCATPLTKALKMLGG